MIMAALWEVPAALASVLVPCNTNVRQIPESAVQAVETKRIPTKVPWSTAERKAAVQVGVAVCYITQHVPFRHADVQ